MHISHQWAACGIFITAILVTGCISKKPQHCGLVDMGKAIRNLDYYQSRIKKFEATPEYASLYKKASSLRSELLEEQAALRKLVESGEAKSPTTIKRMEAFIVQRKEFDRMNKEVELLQKKEIDAIFENIQQPIDKTVLEMILQHRVDRVMRLDTDHTACDTTVDITEDYIESLDRNIRGNSSVPIY